MGAAAVPLMIASAVVGGYSAYQNYRNTAAYSSQQGQMAMIQAGLMQRQYQAMASMQNIQAASYAAQAGIAAKTGELLQANEMAKATQAQREGEEKSRKAAELRRMFVGEGKVRFAANGVLLESRPQSAVAMWEQDEAADLAYELSGIKTQTDNEVFGYIWNGFNARMQGLLDAEALGLQAQAARIEAGNSLINADSAILQGQATVAQGQAATSAALWGFIGNVAGTGMTLGAYGARTKAPTTIKNVSGRAGPAPYYAGDVNISPLVESAA